MKMLKKRDLQILSSMRQQARVSLTKLSRQIQIPVSTIFNRLRDLENQDIIKRSVLLIDYGKLGYYIQAFLLLKVSKKDKGKVKEYLFKSQYVNTFHKINNNYDFSVELICKDILQLENFIEELEDLYTIKQKQVFHLIDEIKKESFGSMMAYNH